MRNLALALVALGGLVLLVYMARERLDPAPPHRTPERSVSAEQPSARGESPPAPLAGSTGGEARRGAPLSAGLAVVVIDGDGGPLNDARSLLTRGEFSREFTGARFELSGLDAGLYRLAVSHPDLPSWTRDLTLEPGAKRRVIVQLRQTLELRGRVTDRFGSPKPRMRVWALRAGERHPTSAEEARALLGAVTDGNGKLRLTLPEEGNWHLSVGAPGRPLLSEAPHAILHGGADRFEAVIGGSTHLEFKVNFPRGAEPLTALVLSRPQEPEPWAVAEKQTADEQRHKRLSEALSRGAIETRPPGTEIRSAPPPQWINLQTRRVAADGTVVFTALPAGEELRVGLIRSGERYESPVVLEVHPDELVRVELELPPPGTTDAEVVMPLPMTWTGTALRADENPAGIHWREER